MRKVNLCPWCIQGLSSHMERIFVGPPIETEDGKCDICGEEPDGLTECLWDTGEETNI